MPHVNTGANVLAPSTGGTVSDYIALLKPRVMSLVVFTALVGMVAAPGSINPVIGFIAILCIAVGAGASGERRRPQPRSGPRSRLFHR